MVQIDKDRFTNIYDHRALFYQLRLSKQDLMLFYGPLGVNFKIAFFSIGKLYQDL